MFRSELNAFKRKLLEDLRANIDKINNDVLRKNWQIRKLGNASKEFSLWGGRDFLEEIAEREMRSKYLVLFNLEEAETSTVCTISDLDLVKDILKTINPRDVIKHQNFKIRSKTAWYPEAVMGIVSGEAGGSALFAWEKEVFRTG